MNQFTVQLQRKAGREALAAAKVKDARCLFATIEVTQHFGADF